MLITCSCGAGRSRVKTIVLVTIDTWRWDATGFLGRRNPSPTPYLDELAASSLVATNAVAPVPLTGPSHWSMLTGRWPWRDGVRVNGDRPPVEHAPTLAEELRAAGWRTAAFVSCAALDHRFGFDAGFEHFDDRFRTGGRITDIGMPERRADETVALVLQWVGTVPASDRLLLWVHLFDPHLPYDPPPQLRQQWLGISRSSPPKSIPAETCGAYLGEVAFADQQVKVLLDGLAAAGRPAAQSLYLILGDHGEGLGDHGALTHGLLLHGAAIRVPLLVAGGQVAPGTRQDPASTADVFATVLEAAGHQVAPGRGSSASVRRDGRSLLTAGPAEDRSLPLETLFGQRSYGLSPAFGLLTRQWLWESSPADHLWDIVHDPEEITDLAGARPQVVAQLRTLRDAIAETPPVDRGAGENSPRLNQDLQALGYVTGGMISGEGDLRSYVTSGEDLHMALLAHQQAGRFREAEAVVTRLLEAYPRSPQLWIEAGFVAVQLGDMVRAEHSFGEAIRLAPENTQARVNLANVLLVSNRRDAAATEYERVLELDAEDLYALYNLGDVRSQQGRYQEAATSWQRFLDLYPNHDRAARVAAALRQWQIQGLIP
jgi:arylsulfatase A-like enzyme/predicted TPR repeat methyltransferase